MENPSAFLFRLALMWRETKMSARPLFAIAVRSSSGMKTSSSRVIRTSNSPERDSFSRILRPIARTTSFSISPVGPIAPGSFPPCPGSILTRTRCFRVEEGCEAAVRGVSTDDGIAGGAGGTCEPADGARGATDEVTDGCAGSSGDGPAVTGAGVSAGAGVIGGTGISPSPSMSTMMRNGPGSAKTR